jgi:hypothetical protein
VEGRCNNKIDDSLECTLVKNILQCVSVLGGTSLYGECENYNGVCKKKCSHILDDTCGMDDRSDDCFWLLGNTSTEHGSNACVDKVWCDK